MSLIFVDLWYFSFFMTYTWSQDFQSFILLSTAATQWRCSDNRWHYSVSTKSKIFLLVTEQAATLSASLRVIYKPKILQSSCQYLLLLLDSSPWAKVIRCGYQEDWQRNQQWVVNMLCATWRHCFDVAAVLSSCSIFICLLRGIHGSCEKYEYITPFTVAVEEIFFIRQRSKTFGQFFLC